MEQGDGGIDGVVLAARVTRWSLAGLAVVLEGATGGRGLVFGVYTDHDETGWTRAMDIQGKT